MSTKPNKPIPEPLLIEFIEYVSDSDDDNLSDSALLAALEEAAGRFMDTHKLRGDKKIAVQQYLRGLFGE